MADRDKQAELVINVKIKEATGGCDKCQDKRKRPEVVISVKKKGSDRRL